ncbi:MAG: ABC transporter ATP-binding protein [Zetaproteobacteria bacterium]|nr:MAG: ABC transporter ATP-binding protein [Zetaproteobacteria bacterium]
MRSALVEVEDLYLSVPAGPLHMQRKPILQGVRFAVPEGARAAYLGPNGAGKTSTFRVLCRLVRPDRGYVRYRGKPWIPPRRMGFLPEQPYFYRNLTPRELLRAFGRLVGMRAPDAAIRHWCARLEVAHVLDQRLSACSKGQLQRIGLVLALLHDPEFLLLDEPMSGLDPLGRELVAEVLREVAAQGKTILFSTHILGDAEDLCDHAIVLHKGRVRYEGAMEALLAGEGRKYRIRFRAAQAWEGARALGGGVQEVVCGAEEKEMLFARLVQAGAEVLELAPLRRSLEEAFSELIGEDRGDA